MQKRKEKPSDFLMGFQILFYDSSKTKLSSQSSKTYCFINELNRIVTIFLLCQPPAPNYTELSRVQIFDRWSRWKNLQYSIQWFSFSKWITALLPRNTVCLVNENCNSTRESRAMCSPQRRAKRFRTACVSPVSPAGLWCNLLSISTPVRVQVYLKGFKPDVKMLQKHPGVPFLYAVLMLRNQKTS